MLYKPIPAKKPTIPVYLLQTSKSFNYSSTNIVQPAQPKSSFLLHNTPVKYTDTLKQSSALPRNFNQNMIPALGANARSSTLCANFNKMKAMLLVNYNVHQVEDSYNAKDHLDPQIHIENVKSVYQKKDIRLKANV
ncbi:hypothetical protein DSL72_003112 [Monilinia vaccinii-corymbosi]|uniref:Uncharacterized protein n=1 Tax=Monilinia vaccinii-corymbosi TaxID=61207 RepID=A0A8A3NT31_9HELO|nr:hypothetical protein DSL72_003112 [Monilinia vaccinii-corymbosi]